MHQLAGSFWTTSNLSVKQFQNFMKTFHFKSPSCSIESVNPCSFSGDKKMLQKMKVILEDESHSKYDRTSSSEPVKSWLYLFRVAKLWTLAHLFLNFGSHLEALEALTTCKSKLSSSDFNDPPETICYGWSFKHVNYWNHRLDLKLDKSKIIRIRPAGEWMISSDA